MRFPIAAALLAATTLPAQAQVAKPAAITIDGVPALAVTLAEQVRPYLEARSASAVAWNPIGPSLLISIRFANVARLHGVAGPLAK